MTKKRNKRQPNPNVDQMSSGTYDESCENVKAGKKRVYVQI